MKRLFALILAVSLVLCGCGGGAAETSAPTTEAPTETTAPVTEATEPTTEPTTVPTEPPVVHTNPLTGEVLEAPFTIRPTAIMINNLNKAVPQCGISKADVLYEMLAEGSVTRFMALFTDLSDVGEIGPVRSMRAYFVRVAQGYDAILCSAGGSPEAFNLVDDLNYDYLNAIGSAHGWFYRDQWRMNNRGYEHSLMTTGTQLADAAVGRSLENTVENADYGFVFDDAAIPAGEAAARIDIHFYRNGKLTRMTWDKETNLYSMYQHGADALDANDDSVLQFRNIVILKASTKVIDNEGRLAVQTTGEGEGWFARDGRIIPIKWSRGDYDQLYAYTDLEGNPISFGTGKTYIAVTTNESNIDYAE